MNYGATNENGGQCRGPLRWIKAASVQPAFNHWTRFLEFVGSGVDLDLVAGGDKRGDWNFVARAFEFGRLHDLA